MEILKSIIKAQTIYIWSSIFFNHKVANPNPIYCKYDIRFSFSTVAYIEVTLLTDNKFCPIIIESGP